MSETPDIQGALGLLDQILTRKKLAGRETIAISDESLALLSGLPAALNRPPVAVPRQEPIPAPAPVSEPPPQPRVAPEQTPGPALPPSAVENQETLSHPYGELAVGTEQRGRVEIIFPAGETKRDKLNNLFRIAKRCDVCRGLGTLRDQMVFATGNPDAELMFVGEAPGAVEEQEKKPFVGPAGEKLDLIIRAMGLKREDVYISNIVKWRPKMGDGRFQGPKNRKPTPQEMAVSVKFVRSEIELIRPKAIVALGGTAAEGLLEQSGSVASLRGKFYELDGIPVAVTYHPSYLLRVEDDSDQERARQEKRKVWEDVLMVMEKMGMPISEKQRGFFTS